MVKIDKFDFPDDLYYWKDHTWAKVEEKGKRVRLGIDAYGQEIAGQLRFIRTKRVGNDLKQGVTFATIETGKWVGPLKSPVSGKIVEVNAILRRKPATANEDPYGNGWFVLVEPSNLDAELKNLYKGEQASTNWLKEQITEI